MKNHIYPSQKYAKAKNVLKNKNLTSFEL